MQKLNARETRTHYKQQLAGTVRWIKKHPQRSEQPEYWIFLGKGMRMPLKRYLWIQHVGEIPIGYVIAYKDGNSKRCVLTNLECVPRAALAERNRSAKAYEKLSAFFKTEAGKEVIKKRTKKIQAFWDSEQGTELKKRRKESSPFITLTDGAVALYIAYHDPELRKTIIEKYPEIIELKRNILKIKRLCQKN